ncbi:MAG TPA: hypothetical protein VF533_03015 [Solirubrobacteraceae bacterium]
MEGSDYYSTSAQVLPVLLLLLVVESWRSWTEHGGVFELGLLAFASFILSAGEAAALHVLSSGKPTHNLHLLIDIAYLWAGISVFALIIVPRLAQLELTRTHTQHVRIGVAVYLILLFGTVTLIVS